MFKTLAVAGLSLSCLLVSGVASANWQLLNDKSQLSFVSIKKNSIAEASHFTQLSGQLSEQGQFSVNVDLTSAETFIPIRNERLSKILFESDTFANAKTDHCHACGLEIAHSNFCVTKADQQLPERASQCNYLKELRRCQLA